MGRLARARICLCALVLTSCAAIASRAVADVTLHTSELEWANAWQSASGPESAVYGFELPPYGLYGLTAEPPSSWSPPQTWAGGVLTFPRALSGGCRSFAIRAEQPGAAIVYGEYAGNVDSFSALSIGAVGSHSDDDFTVTFFDGAPVFAFGLYVAHNSAEAGEHVDVTTTAGTTVFGGLPDASSTPAFIGFVSDQPIVELRFDEDPGADELALHRFRFDDPAQVDSDGDGLDNCSEAIAHGTNALEPDTDGDGLRDGFEVAHGFDPTVAGEQHQDADGDGLDNLAEQAAGSDPLRTDSDGDGLSDPDEVLTYLTNPSNADTDDDGMRDPFEVSKSFDPRDPGDAGQDADGDELSNFAEQQRNTDPRDPDTDHDDLLDGAEVSRILALGFGSAHAIPTSIPACATAPADFDGDGALDLAAVLCTYGTQLAWYRNALHESSGGFGPEVGLGANASSVTTPDLDRDGDPDLLIAYYFHGIVTWRENRLSEPSGDFAPERTIATGVPQVKAAIGADIDGDGDLDLVAASIDDDAIYWSPNRLDEPSADFGPQQRFAFAPLGAPQYEIAALASADFDRDGDIDLVSGSWNGSQGITWYENRRNTVSQDFTAHPIDSNGVHGDSLIAADVDRDGDADVIGEFGYRAAWYENRLDEPSADFAPLRVISPEGDVLSTALADLDGDGAPDLLAADAYRDKLVWHPNRLASPSADFGPERLVAVADFSRWVSAADLDGDGDPDAVFAAPDGLRWFRNPGTDPHDPDSDGDGLSDGYEVAHGLDPLPEPEGALSLLAGIAALAALRTSSRRPS